MYAIHAYKRVSRGAKALAKALKGRRLRPGDAVPSDTTVINWGDGECPYEGCLNKPSAVRLASNKKLAFIAMHAAGVRCPPFATDKASASWKGVAQIVVRHKLQGHSGEGIELVEIGKELPDAPLYVAYIKKEQEFRIHVGRKNGETKIIAVQRKARDRSVPNENVNWQVRNHHNGFIFVRDSANPSDDTLQQACNALVALGLDFGAVDVIENSKEGKAYVLEINTAPGLEGQTIEDYANFFRG